MTRPCHILVRDREGYPYAELMAGLSAHGLTPQPLTRATPDPRAVLVTWTPWRGGLADRVGSAHASRGGDWIVCENGYLGGKNHVAMGRAGYNGWGVATPTGRPPDRFETLELKIEPWRESGEHILVIGQAGGTDHRFTMPLDWPDKVIECLRRLTNRPIIYRPKPTRPEPLASDWSDVTTADRHVTLDELFEGAHAVVVYNSKVAGYALLKGVPVLYDAAHCALSALYLRGLDSLENPPQPDRWPFFCDLAYAQRSRAEIASGAAFSYLLSEEVRCAS